MALYSYFSDDVDIVDVSRFSDEPSGPIFLDAFHCNTGNEERLDECQYDELHMCSHQQDIGIICQRKYTCSFTL